MKGGIYSDQRCPACGGRFNDNGRDGLICPDHPEQRASKFKVLFPTEGKLITRRFKAYDAAARFLTGLRFKCDEEGHVDWRDYSKEMPFGFENLIRQWLNVKKSENIKADYHKTLSGHAERAIVAWGNRNIKTIQFADIQKFILSQKVNRRRQAGFVAYDIGDSVSKKTQADIIACLREFWGWARKCKILSIEQMPDFPEISVVLKFRNIISKDVQAAILEEVKRISYHIDPKIWLGIKWLATYYNVRPGELRIIREGQIRRDEGVLFFPVPKDKIPKVAPLVEEDLAILKSMPIPIDPSLYFFRHQKRKGVTAGKLYSVHFFKDYWNRACRNLGIKDVDLYGGTRHSTARALAKEFSPETIMRGSGHHTSKAFRRYFDYATEELREIYRCTVPKSSDKGLTKDSGPGKNGKLLKYK